MRIATLRALHLVHAPVSRPPRTSPGGGIPRASAPRSRAPCVAQKATCALLPVSRAGKRSCSSAFRTPAGLKLPAARVPRRNFSSRQCLGKFLRETSQASNASRSESQRSQSGSLTTCRMTGTYEVATEWSGEPIELKITATHVLWKGDKVSFGAGAEWVGRMLKVDALLPAPVAEGGLDVRKEQLILNFEAGGLVAQGLVQAAGDPSLPVTAKLVGRLVRDVPAAPDTQPGLLKRILQGLGLMALAALAAFFLRGSMPAPTTVPYTATASVAQLQPSTKQSYEYSSRPYAVVWHVQDHAEGRFFSSMATAKAEYDERYGGPWAERLYDSEGRIVREYGSMPRDYWKQLDGWREANLPEGDRWTTGTPQVTSSASMDYSDEGDVALPVILEAANGYGLSAAGVGPNQQLHNTRLNSASDWSPSGLRSRNFIVRNVGPDLIALESVANPGFYIAIDDARALGTPYYKGSSDKYAAVLVKGKADARTHLRAVPSRNGSEEFVSLEPARHPGRLLNHCDGLMWFFGSPANNESTFAQDASWRLDMTGDADWNS